jgi:phage gp46-like protein
MDFAIETTDGITGQMTFDQATDRNLSNNIFLSLAVRRGSFFQNPSFGSRLYLLLRKKNSAQTAALAKEYVREALQWIVDAGRASAIDITVERDTTVDLSRLKLLIQATKADGETVTFTTFTEVV